MRMERLKADATAPIPSGAPSLEERTDAPAVRQIIAGERKLFESRRSGRLGQKAQLRSAIKQLLAEIEGLDGLLTAK